MASHTVDIDGIEALKVPLLTQPNTENECLLYAVGMALRYCADNHPSKVVRENTNPITPGELKERHITVRETGWAPSPEDLEDLSENLGVVSLEMKYWRSSPPFNAFDDVVWDSLNDNLPVIAIVDAKMIQGIDSENGQHAIVVTGAKRSHVVVNDPWGRRHQTFRKDTITDAWDTQLNRLVTLDTSEQQEINQELATEVAES